MSYIVNMTFYHFMIKMHFAEGGDRVNEVSSSGFFGGITENISVFYNPYMFLFVFYIYCAYYCCSNVCLKFELCISMKRDKDSLRS